MDIKSKYINRIKNDGVLDYELKNTLIETLIGIDNPIYLDIYCNELERYFLQKTKLIQNGLLKNHERLNIFLEDINRLIIRGYLDKEVLENEGEKTNIESNLINNFF